MGRLTAILLIICVIASCSKPSEVETSVKKISYSTHKLSNTTIGSSGVAQYEVDIFPMPFQDSVTVRLFLDGESPVSLSITDEKGDFYDAVNDFFDSGTYDIGIAFSNFSPGIYMMELKIGSIGDRFQMIKVEQL